ncbi:MAG: peptide chain release factor N(5)-glutamine methyltransferase [Planctomycetota bacterium]
MTKPQTIRDLLPVASGWLAEQGAEEARLDTELLLAHVLGIKRLALYLDHDRPLTAAQLQAFRALMRRRGERREPVAYILGERAFHGLDLEVDRHVLIPRQDTETLVEVGLEELERLAGERLAPRFCDVGTGSGCVALALARGCPDARGFACDRSGPALAVARRNAERLGLSPQVRMFQGDLLGAVRPESLDLVVSNPPYVLESERGLLAPEVLQHEPHAALFDAEGLPLTRRLAAEAWRALRPSGALAVETGFDKAPLVAGFLAAAGFVEVRRVTDLGGVERVVVGRRPPAADEPS